jgi:hypothetical protein
MSPPDFKSLKKQGGTGKKAQQSPSEPPCSPPIIQYASLTGQSCILTKTQAVLSLTFEFLTVDTFQILVYSVCHGDTDVSEKQDSLASVSPFLHFRHWKG